jgi:hypothetical protein
MWSLTVPSVGLGFGKHVSWQDGEALPPKHGMSFKRAIHLMSVDILFKLIFSERILGLTKRTRDVRDAYHELKVRVRLGTIH